MFLATYLAIYKLPWALFPQVEFENADISIGFGLLYQADSFEAFKTENTW